MTSRKIKPFHLEYVNMWMSNTSNPELTAQCILQKLEKQCGVQVSKEYVCALRRRLNWSAKHMKYGQLISHKNVRLRCDWCFQQLISKDTYPNVVYVDESTVEMCSSGRLVFHQHGSNLDRLPAKSPKPKHSFKVNVWGEFPIEDQPTFVFSQELWTPKFTKKFLRITFFHLHL